MRNNLSVYIDIPFCRKKCVYCDFPSFVCTESTINSYIDQLISEIDAKSEMLKSHYIRTVFIGGGTPSLLSVYNMKSLLKHFLGTIKNIPDEFTIECNPESVTVSKLKLFKSYGVNRLSIGLQSTEEKELELLGRCHTYKDFEIAYDMIRKLGFDNVNIDLMFNLPNQKSCDFKKSLKRIIDLKCEHISCYGLIVENNTLLKKYLLEKKYPYPDEDEYIKTYDYIVNTLNLNGYTRYEISNFALKGKECLHNQVYWQREDYAGLGLSAASFILNRRFSNPSTLKEYLSLDCEGFINLSKTSVLSEQDIFEESVFLSLRMMQGLDVNVLKEKCPLYTGYNFENTLNDLIKRKLIKRTGNYISLDDNAVNISESIFLELITKSENE